MIRTALIPLATLFVAVAVFAWSSINPFERSTWWMEVAPALIALPLLVLTYKRFRLTDLSYALIGIHACILMVGGKYTYARVPLFDFIEGTRNNYDKLGHFAQGFIPAIIIRELLLRTSPLQPGKWLAAVIVFSCLGISAAYELIEWLAAVLLGQGAEEFLGTQGDEWDTQKDMLWAGIGACTALLTLSRWHNRQLERI
ncbi:MAG: hypothetical protein DI626_09230 [Micavibrio aeruginosavorus]|uniref:DUF2238 domain-containing protein n=1 Tax=Micavibrio aeruginosavorus TaxID=349221 RepID=A0A2W4ZPJ2_9BACT|nr:MAG: hypothetical protein DI626_09230 [Micavibrio aeruginosavorus]